jgi:hypothetical protein
MAGDLAKVVSDLYLKMAHLETHTRELKGDP